MTRPKQNQGWAIKCPEGLLFNSTILSMEKDVISEFAHRRAVPWCKFYEKGYRAVKVEINEIEEFG